MKTFLELIKLAGGWYPGLYLKIDNPPYMQLVIEAMDESGPCGLPAVSVCSYAFPRAGRVEHPACRDGRQLIQRAQGRCQRLKVDTDAIKTKVRQEFAAKEKAKRTTEQAATRKESGLARGGPWDGICRPTIRTRKKRQGETVPVSPCTLIHDFRPRSPAAPPESSSSSGLPLRIGPSALLHILRASEQTL